MIPTYNNVGTIGQVVRQALEACQDVIVVSDGSTDGTTELLRGIEGITLVEYPRNRGKGYALKQGLRKARQMGFAYAITLDGDGQHYPRDISRFVEANKQHPGALIVGRRNLAGVERSKGSSFANKFSNFWFYVQTGRRLQDTQTGYRLYPLKKLHGLALLTSRYEAELELLVFASWHGVRLVEIPIDVYYPPREERVSHFRPAKDFARISVLNTVLCFLAVVYGLPLRLWRGISSVVRTVYSLLFVVFFSCCVITPAVWLYVKKQEARGKKQEARGKKQEARGVRREERDRTGLSERKVYNLHRIIYHAMRFVMLKHGIPGVRFTYHVDERATIVDHDAKGGDVKSQPSVIICNHQSHIDLACQLILTPRMIFLTNQWVWHSALYGFLIRHAEFYPVAEGIDELMPRLRSLVERGYSIAVYPEGTRSKDCRIARFHQGAFHIARELGLSITPVCLYGPGRVLPKGSHWLNKGPVYMEVGAPISQETLQQMGDARQQASAMRKYYKEWYERLANKIEQDV